MKRTVSKHPLIADALAGLRPEMMAGQARIKATVKKYGTMRVKNPKPFKSAAARYRHLVFHHAIKVGTDFESLENIVAMARKLPTARTLRTWQFSADRWLEYQYTLHLVTLVGAVDRTLMTDPSPSCHISMAFDRPGPAITATWVARMTVAYAAAILFLSSTDVAFERRAAQGATPTTRGVGVSV